MSDPADTTPEDLLRAADFAHDAGLRYVYAGNLPGMVGGSENTECHNCHEILIRRYSYLVQEYRLTPDGRCPKCKTSIPGRWSTQFDGQITDRPFLPPRAQRLVTIS